MSGFISNGERRQNEDFVHLCALFLSSIVLSFVLSYCCSFCHLVFCSSFQSTFLRVVSLFHPCSFSIRTKSFRTSFTIGLSAYHCFFTTSWCALCPTEMCEYWVQSGNTENLNLLCHLTFIRMEQWQWQELKNINAFEQENLIKWNNWMELN